MKISFKKLLLGLVIAGGIVAYTTNMSGGAINNIVKKDKLDAMLKDDKNKSMVVKFHAVWCGACKTMKPLDNKMAKSYGTVKFVYIDIDKADELKKAYNIVGVPTYIFFKNGKKVDSHMGIMEKPEYEDKIKAIR